MLPLHGISAGDSLLVVALLHRKADAWVTSFRIVRDDDIMSVDMNGVTSDLQTDIARQLNSQLEG